MNKMFFQKMNEFFLQNANFNTIKNNFLNGKCVIFHFS